MPEVKKKKIYMEKEWACPNPVNAQRQQTFLLNQDKLMDSGGGTSRN